MVNETRTEKTNRQAGNSTRASRKKASDKKQNQPLNDSELKKKISSYEQIIKEYELHYNKENGCTSQEFYHYPFYPSSHIPHADEGYHTTDQFINEYEEILDDCENNVQSIEKIIYDFKKSYAYVKKSNKDKKIEFTDMWNERLKDSLETNNKTINYIQKYMNLIKE